MIKQYKFNPNKKEADYGYVIQAIGPVIDVRFDEGLIPSMRTALEVEIEHMDKKSTLTL